MSDTHNDLQQALNSINPTSLDYTQWITVGMALKEDGYDVSVWENWSRADSRYNKGECERKWKSFQGTSNPVTISSVYDLAFKSGYVNEGYELGWEDTLSDTDRIINPRWVEAQEVHEPRAWNPAEELISYLQALFEPTENVGYCTECFEKNGKWMPSRGNYDRTAGQLIEALSKCDGDISKVVGDYRQNVGAWIRFNPLDGEGCKNTNVTEYRFALVESDIVEIEKQNAIIRELELPVAALVHSGNKSLHAIVRIDAPNYSEYQKRVDYLYSVCKKNGLALDVQNRNPSRLSRMPGVVRNNQKQFLIDTHIGKSTFEEWKEFIEASIDDLPDTENLSEVWDDMPELAPSLIDGVLRQGHKMLLAGPSKAGKSFALIELCVAIAEKTKWLGNFNCTQGKILYINLELDRASCFHRFKDVYTSLKIPPKNFNNIDIWNLRGASVPMDKLAPKLIRRAAKKNYIAVIIDPIYKVITGDENSADQMAKFCNQFDIVCKELNCAVIYCHHHSKGSQEQKRSVDRASGSGVFARDPDAMLDLLEIDLTQSVYEHLKTKAICEVCTSVLERENKIDELSQDELLSSVQMQLACERLLPQYQQEVDRKIDQAVALSKSQTAWRIEGTLREFAKFEPVNTWFKYPVHVKDDIGILADIVEKESGKKWEKNFKPPKKQSAEERKEIQNKSLETAYEACASMGDKVTKYMLAEYMGVTEKTVRRRIQSHGGYWIENAEVGKK